MKVNIQIFNDESLHSRFPTLFLRIFWGLLFFVLYWRHFSNFDFQNGAIPQDFKVYTDAIAQIKQGISPYDFRVFLTFKYSPGVLAVLSLLPTHPIDAWLVAKGIYLISFFSVMHICFEVKKWRDFLFLLFGFLLSWKGLIEALDYGQFEYLLFSIAYLSFYFVIKKPLLSGVLAGVLPWIKLPWGLLLIPLIVYSKKNSFDSFTKTVFGIALSSILMGALIPLLLFSPDKLIALYGDWFEVLSKQPKYLMYLEVANQSVWATISRWIDFDFVVNYKPFLEEPTFWKDRSQYRLEFLFGFFLSIFLGAVSFFSLIRLNIHYVKKASLKICTHWLVLLALINPLSWRWSQLLFVGLFLSYNDTLLKNKAKYFLGFALIVLYLLQLNPIVKILGFGHWTNIHVCGLITVHWLIYYIITLKMNHSLENKFEPIQKTIKVKRVNFVT